MLRVACTDEKPVSDESTNASFFSNGRDWYKTVKKGFIFNILLTDKLSLLLVISCLFIFILF